MRKRSPNKINSCKFYSLECPFNESNPYTRIIEIIKEFHVSLKTSDQTRTIENLLHTVELFRRIKYTDDLWNVYLTHGIFDV